MTKIKDLTPDSKNANRGTAKGQKLLVKSVQMVGVARPGLLDKNNQVVAGNKSTEAFAEVFGVDVEPIIIESDGKRPIYHKRVDWDLNDPAPNNPARQAAYLDNVTNFFNLDFDPVMIMADMESGFDFEAIDIGVEELEQLISSMGESALKERKEELRPKRFARVLLSIPVDDAIFVKEYLDQIAKIPGIEIDYGGN